MSLPIEFESDSDRLTATAQKHLGTIATTLAGYSKPLEIVGHTDNTGDAEQNLALSQARAQTVANTLIASGFPAELISASGMGQQHPIASNETEVGRAKNRRVEFLKK